jgi:hypothetical protein
VVNVPIEVTVVRLYTKSPGSHHLRKSSAGELATLLAAGWQEKQRKAGPEAYEVSVEWDGDGPARRARTLRDARQLAEEAYIEVWRDGKYLQRGPVQAP